LIKLQNLSFRYSGTQKPALRGINLEVGDGEFVLLTGPSGGGKSTLCRCLNGLVPHFYGGELSGKVEVEGLDVLTSSTRQLATRVGMVFQDPENQTVATDVEREIAFGLENLALPRELMVRRVEEALDSAGITHLRRQPVTELSGGERQKIAIAAVLVLHPSILVLDEPTSELDPRGAEEVLNLVERLNDELGLTIILVEHRLDRVVQHVDRVIVLKDGELLSDGSPREVLGEMAQGEIGLPPVVRLARGLKARGITFADTPLTVKEGRAILAEVLRERKLSPSEPPRYNLEPRSSPLGPEPRAPLIEVKKLHFAYEGEVTVLKDINLQIFEGEFVALMGRNGSGKTTLVKHFNGLLKPTRGEVIVDGLNTRDTSVATLARKVGYVFQNPNVHLLAESVEEEIAFTLKNLGFKGEEKQKQIEKVLERFDLTRYRSQYPRSLSGGEKQRVAIASVLAAQPKIIILDEPTRGMEYQLKSELMEFLNEYRKDGRAVILVTQDVELVAEHADRVILLNEGRIVAEGDKREVLSGALLFSPQINRLAQSLRNHGLPHDILTADEVLGLL